MKCVTCQKTINAGFMCDRSDVHDTQCEDCFGTVCETKHPEDCLTMVFSDEEEPVV